MSITDSERLERVEAAMDQIRTALLGGLDSLEPGLKQEVRELRSDMGAVKDHLGKLNSRTGKNESKINKAIWVVSGAWAVIFATVVGAAWLYEHGVRFITTKWP